MSVIFIITVIIFVGTLIFLLDVEIHKKKT